MKDKMADKHSADVHNIEPQARDITEGKQSQDASALLSAIVDREAREIDAVLLDVRLPKKTGDQVFREMRTVTPLLKLFWQVVIWTRKFSILGLGGQPDSKTDIVDDHQDLVGKLKAEF